ncbi:hypothetical protein MKL37_10880 [Acinetobacter sp. AOR11_HL]|uniref:hypothetical protein n=1 Tax=Acinetobacter sp. AOR11_HL TaxID=2919377 RepID=UPI0022EB17B1|nr:hypothetical protein [Acinetobacter sp. AOR11_HL]MDA3550920.1 hypothetical protein [Acinetobacter sp. AOR11_HL]
MAEKEDLVNSNSQIEDLAKLQLLNKKRYSELSKEILKYFSYFSPDDLINNGLDINDFTDKIKSISAANNKIRSSIYSINSHLKTIELKERKDNIESLLISNVDSLKSEVLEIDKLIIRFEQEFSRKTFQQFLRDSGEVISNRKKAEIVSHNNYKKIYYNLNPSVIRKIEIFKMLNNEIFDKTLLLLKVYLKTKNEIIDLINKEKELENLDYIERFKEDTDFILKKYEANITNLTSKLQTRINNLNLKQTEIENNSSLLNSALDSSLKNLAKINERINNVEIEFHNLINKESININKELSNEHKRLKTHVNEIIYNIKKKSEEIYTDHQDFKNLVEKAGIYELTQNYNEKSREEKSEYTTYRKFTAWAIIAAIVSTVLIFIVAFIEHYFASAKDETNYILLGARLSISVMFFVLALYLSKQASKHYECYQENHRTFLQLAALEPFMARMTPEEQKEIRKGLIPSYFNQSSDGKFAAKDDEIGIPSSIGERLDKGFETIKEMIASKKDSQN